VHGATAAPDIGVLLAMRAIPLAKTMARCRIGPTAAEQMVVPYPLQVPELSNPMPPISALYVSTVLKT
jgi:hypothetical protein